MSNNMLKQTYILHRVFTLTIILLILSSLVHLFIFVETY